MYIPRRRACRLPNHGLFILINCRRVESMAVLAAAALVGPITAVTTRVPPPRPCCPSCLRCIQLYMGLTATAPHHCPTTADSDTFLVDIFTVTKTTLMLRRHLLLVCLLPSERTTLAVVSPLCTCMMAAEGTPSTWEWAPRPTTPLHPLWVKLLQKSGATSSIPHTPTAAATATA